MQLLTTSLRKQLIANHHANKKAQKEEKGVIDFAPVVKFFFPIGAATWLITEMDEEEMMCGLCDLGHGFPELGYVHLHELQNTKFMNGMVSVERDKHWKAKGTLQDYTNKAQLHGRIVA